MSLFREAEQVGDEQQLSLMDLPNEMIQQIEECLPLSSAVAFALTCRRLRDIMLTDPMARLRHEQEGGEEEEEEKEEEESELFKLLKCLEKDSILGGRALDGDSDEERAILLACEECVKLHPYRLDPQTRPYSMEAFPHRWDEQHPEKLRYTPKVESRHRAHAWELPRSPSILVPCVDISSVDAQVPGRAKGERWIPRYFYGLVNRRGTEDVMNFSRLVKEVPGGVMGKRWEKQRETDVYAKHRIQIADLQAIVQKCRYLGHEAVTDDLKRWCAHTEQSGEYGKTKEETIIRAFIEDQRWHVHPDIPEEKTLVILFCSVAQR